MTDKRIPVAPLTLGLLGVLPFLWSAATHLSPALAGWALGYLTPMFVGAYVGLSYGTIILSFMSGVLWGFATKAQGASAVTGYVLSVIPALWAFVMIPDASTNSLIFLATGFAGLLLLDASFAAQGLAPQWWLRLRILLTAIVLGCLAILILT